MKVFKRILLGLLLLILILFVISFFLPKTLHVERSAVISATPSAIYSILNDLKSYDKWMSWNQVDPNWKVQYGEPSSGTGAWYKWESQNRNVGTGKLTITESVPAQKVMTRLEFEGMAPATGGWILTQQNNATDVRWYMDANMGSNPVARWMAVVAMDKMVGDEFDKGLGNIKRLAESSAKQ